MPPKLVSPPLEDLPNLRQPLTKGEKIVLDYFLKRLPSGWEVYIQPHLNGMRPDFVLLHPENGIAVYEVKDWDLRAMDYSVKERDGRAPILIAHSDGKTFSIEKQNPVTKIDVYKQEIYNLYCPRLPTNTGFGAIVAGIIFPFSSTPDVSKLLSPLRRHYKHDEFPRLYPVIGNDVLENENHWALKQNVLPIVHQSDHRMSAEIAADLRHWLVEPAFSTEQRRPLLNDLTQRQKEICFNTDNVAFRRIRGPAGSGKSFVLAGRAAQLAVDGKRVLVITFNITLINYLLDLAVRFAQNGNIRKQIEALNFHYWCKRIALLTGHFADYDELWADDSGEDVLKDTLAAAVSKWLEDLDDSERWDAILLDEGQDFELKWWKTLRKALIRNGKGEALLCADNIQNIYGVKPWTEDEMPGAGFRGKWMSLDESHRMSPSLCRLAKTYIDMFLPEVDEQRPEPRKGEIEFKTILKWWQVSNENASQACFDALIDIITTSDPPIAYSDLVCIVDNAELGLEVVGMLNGRGIGSIHTFGSGDNAFARNMDSRRKKLAFFKGDARVKLTTLHSFKGWETKALVVYISRANSVDALALAYAGITRLKRDDRGCYLTVVNSAVELIKYGRKWPVYEEIPRSLNS